MTISEKNNNEKLYSKENYIISAPTVLSTEKKEFGESYLFLFDEPLINLEGAILHNDFDEVDNELITNSDGQCAGTSDYINSQSDKKKLNGKVTYNHCDTDGNGDKLGNISIIDTPNEKKKQILLPAKETVKFAFSMPDYIIHGINKTNNSLIETKVDKVKQCKVCWIFKKPTCKDCVTIINDEEELTLYNRSEICQTKTSDNSSEKKPCKSCWVFQNKNCDICKSSRKTEICISKVSTTASSESEVREKKITLKIPEDYEMNLLVTGEADLNNTIITENENKSMKRKIAEDSYKIPAKKAKWQCNICLTENKTNRETCICCEHSLLVTETSVSKFNWGHNEIFALNLGQKVVTNVSTFTDNTNVNVASERSGLETTKVELKVNNTQDLSLSMKEEINEQQQKKIFEKLPIEESMEIIENIVTIVDRGTNVGHTIDQTFSKYMNNNNTQQSHDLNFSNLSFHDANMDSEDIFKALPLQFNIGKGPREEKKNLRQYKKPLRRTSKK